MQFLRRAEYAGLFLLALGLYYRSEGSWWLFALLFLAPDLSMLGYSFGSRIGALVYNIGHSFLSVMLLAGVGFAMSLPWAWQLALIWMAHIGFDRMLGYGLKYASGFQDTHMGRIGRNQTRD